jgi:nickel/cobalt transporter (NicO) family protein
MSNEILILAATASTLGLIHTVLGPDHYLPFIVLSRDRKWSTSKTAVITSLCGLGHVLSSVALGFAGIALGLALFQLQAIESLRGELTAWLIIIFGFSYMCWGIFRVVRSCKHEHPHLHMDGETHTHVHDHTRDHSHIHFWKNKNLTPWVLFLIFVFGPCEPLIPLVMYPAAKHNLVGVAIVSTVFGLATISTMLAIVLTSSYGLSRLRFGKLEKYSHALAGFAILASGGAIKLFGL